MSYRIEHEVTLSRVTSFCFERKKFYVCCGCKSKNEQKLCNTHKIFCVHILLAICFAFGVSLLLHINKKYEKVSLQAVFFFQLIPILTILIEDRLKTISLILSVVD